MKITFLIPPVKNGRAAERLFGCTYQIYPQPNLVVLYAAAPLEKNHEIRVFDFPVLSKKYSEFLNWFKKDQSDIYCFHTVPLSLRLDLEVARLIKNKPVIFFGPTPTFSPSTFLINENFYVLRGEVEETIPSLIKAIKKKRGFNNIPGLSYLNKGRIINNKSSGFIKDINRLKIPNRRLIAYQKYRNPKLPKNPYTVLLTSRACPAQCYYCVPNSLSYARELEWKQSNHELKPPVRLRSPENVYQELKDIKNLEIKSISVIDDNFIFDKGRHLKLCHQFKKIGLPYGILTRCDTLIDEEIVKALADSGCVYVDLGVESFNQKILDDVGKNLKVATIYKSIELLFKYKIKPKLNILYGASIFETKQTLKDTLEKVKKLPISEVQFAITSPFPGTEFTKIAIKKGWTDSNDVSNIDPSKTGKVSYPHLSAKELEKWVRYSYKSFYLRPKIILKNLLRVRSYQDFFVYSKGLLHVLK